MFRNIRYFYSNLKTFDCLQTMNHHLASNKFPYTLVYFRANWNPQCKMSDQHISQFANENAAVHCIKIDSDVAPKIARHYGVKAEPQFVFCLYGDEIVRQIGVNYDGLNEKLNKIQALSKEPSFAQIQSKWVPYGQRFQIYHRQTLSNLYKKYVTGL